MQGVKPSQRKEKKKEPRKTRNMMYQQQLDYLPDSLKDNLEETLNSLTGIKQWASIVHTLDVREGKKGYVEPHIHIMMHFTNPRSIREVAKELNDAPEHVRRWDDNHNNGFCYLIHATEGARSKFQYSAQDVKANFDFVALINRVSIKASRHGTKNKIERMLDSIAKGELTIRHAKELLSGSEYADSARALDRAHSLYLERCADRLYEEMIVNKDIVEVHWIYGATETGKTLLAKTIAEKYGEYYKTSTLKDPFQYYQAEPVIILDEFRPGIIPYSELLEMFDPHSSGKVTMSSRYYNKRLACKIYIVTTPFDPVSFFRAYHTEVEDKGEQLYRRLSTVLLMDMDYIYKMQYDPFSGRYITAELKENNYSRKHHKEVERTDLFRMI